METAGGEITSLEADTCKRTTCWKKREKKAKGKSLYRNVWSKSPQMHISVLSAALEADWEASDYIFSISIWEIDLLTLLTILDITSTLLHVSAVTVFLYVKWMPALN